MGIRITDKRKFIFRIKIKLILFYLVINNFLFLVIHKNDNKKNIKVALCTMGKRENLYVKEFIEYYMKLGIEHIFIYDDNDPEEEKIIEAIEKKYLNKVTIYEAQKLFIRNQSMAFSECYNNNLNNYHWFLMVDMDEFLYIVGDTLTGYLKNTIFNKCDFINFHWVMPTDNDLIYYDSRPLLKRFGPPYLKSKYVKTIIRGSIPNLKYSIHSPYISPQKNVTCNNIGKRIYYKNFVELEGNSKINTKKAYIIHFRYKSTEEFINKYKRGYRNWFNEGTEKLLIDNLKEYLEINKMTNEKREFIEKELNLNLSNYINNITENKSNKLRFNYFL